MADPSFTLVQLRYFATAAELGSMTGAAKELMVSQSAISTAIGQLERDLGVQLLIRHHARGLSLTPVGQEFLSELRRFLLHAHELGEVARGVGRSVVGDLVVGWFSTLTPFYLPTIVRAYEERYPDSCVRVIEGQHSQLTDDLREGRCELAIMYAYGAGDLRSRVVDSVHPYVLVAADHKLASRKSVRLKELVDQPMVLLDLPHTTDYFLALFGSRGLPEPAIRFRSGGYETVRALVAHGHGFAILNQRPLHDLTYDGAEVRMLEIKDDVESLDVVVAWPSDARLTRRAQAFIRLVTSKKHSG
ncbi:MAG: LysR family transcriptional regulator [Nocardioidaceae bacterium]